MNFISPDGSVKVTNTILAFVDDTSIRVNTLGIWENDGTQGCELERISQDIMQQYEKYLHLTGVQLNLKKTFIYHLVPDKSS